MQSLLLHERRSKSPPPRMSYEQLAPRISMNNRSDPYPQQVQASEDEDDFFAGRCKLVNGALIIGSGPSGMAVAACLRRAGVPFVILERENCIASLWQRRAYDRLQLNVPKESCQLPYIPFPDDFPERLSKQHLIDYLQSYARSFEIDPRFNEAVRSAKYDETCGLWRVQTYDTVGGGSTVVYICRWLVVASGENAEKVEPEFEGLRGEFAGRVIHSCDYKSGESYRGKRVLVVGSGNSGIDISLDLRQYNAIPTMVVRDSGRELPWEYLGGVKIVPGIKKFSSGAVELDNGEVVDIDSVILATGYTSNVTSWLEKNDLFSSNGYPLKPFPHGWKGRGGLYAAGFTRRGLYGASADAFQVAADISKLWKQKRTRSPFTDIKLLVKEEQRPRKVARCQ